MLRLLVWVHISRSLIHIHTSGTIEMNELAIGRQFADFKYIYLREICTQTSSLCTNLRYLSVSWRIYIYIYVYVCVCVYIYIYIYKAKCCIGRPVHAYTTSYRRPAVYFYVIDFTIMSNWNIVCNTNIHHILQYCYDFVIITYTPVYTKCGLLKTYMLRCHVRETGVSSEVSYTYLQ